MSNYEEEWEKVNEFMAAAVMCGGVLTSWHSYMGFKYRATFRWIEGNREYMMTITMNPELDCRNDVHSVEAKQVWRYIGLALKQWYGDCTTLLQAPITDETIECCYELMSGVKCG